MPLSSSATFASSDMCDDVRAYVSMCPAPVWTEAEQLGVRRWEHRRLNDAADRDWAACVE